MVQGAVYDAVNAIDKSHRPYLDFQSNATQFDSQDAAAATAAHDVLLALYPARQTLLDGWLANSLGTIPNGASKTGGIAAGQAAAAAMLAARANDGRFPTTPFPFVFGTVDTPGVWRLGPQKLTPTSPPGQPIDPTPWVGNVKPFLVPNAEMLRTKGPNELTSRAYALDFNEVKSVGALNSTTRTADQTMAAIFWQEQPAAVWGDLLRQLAGPSHYNLSTADNARLFAMVTLAGADAAIGCWNDKYYWNFWRPIDAIREAANDGNPDTTADPAWLPLFDPATPTAPALVSPGFPDHPSGHTCLTGATMDTLRHFFHTDTVPGGYDIHSVRFPGQARHFDAFSQTLEEIISARVWGGIHFRHADEAGAKLGKEVAHYERAHFFKAVDDDD